MGFYLKNAPRAYPATPQQQKVVAVAKECGIRKGMTKMELMIAMKECVGPKMKEPTSSEDQTESGPPSSPPQTPGAS